MESVERIVNWFSGEYRKNGLKWLAGIKYTGMVVSPVLSAFGAVRAYKEIERKKKEKNVEKLPLKDTALIVAKNEAFAVLTTAGGIAATAKSDQKMKETIDALTTLVVVGDNKFKEFKEAEKEVVGEEKHEEIQKKADEKALHNVDTRDMERDPERGIYPCLETKTGQIIRNTSKAKIENAFSMVKREVIRDNVFLGQFIEACGGIWYMNNIEACTVGSEYVWPESTTNEYEIEIGWIEDMYGNPMMVIYYPENGGLTNVNDLPWKIEH